MTIGILILVLFLAAAFLMFMRLLPALLALPLMAVAIIGIEIAAGRLTVYDLGHAVLADGAGRLSEAMIIAMFGGMLSMLMQKGGVAESMVRGGAELAGDNPWIVALAMLGIIALLFTTIGGLGAVIMVGTVVLPILVSIGVREKAAAGIVLIGIALGGALNPTNWVVYRTILGIDREDVASFGLSLFALTACVGIAFVTLELILNRAMKITPKGLGQAVAIGVLLLLLLAGWESVAGPLLGGIDRRAVQWGVGAAGLLLAGYVLFDRRRGPAGGSRPPVRWYAYGIPLVPLVLILLYDFPYVVAFVCGLLYGVCAMPPGAMVKRTSRAIIEGSASVIPAVALMIGIGILLSAILGPTAGGPGEYWHEHARATGEVWPVLADMRPLLELIIPSTAGGYILIFSLLGPLALYRGPLNVWGLGYGIGGVLLATGFPPGAIMGVLMSLGMIQGISDPTNTANVWIANEVRVDVTTLMWRTLPYAWIAAIAGLVVAGVRFM